MSENPFEVSGNPFASSESTTTNSSGNPFEQKEIVGNPFASTVSSRVNQIPGLENTVDPTYNTKVNPLAADIAQYGPVAGPLTGIAENAGNIAMMIPQALGGAANMIGNMFTQKQSAADAFSEGMGNLTREAQSQTGQYLQDKVVNPFFENAMALAGHGSSLELPHITEEAIKKQEALLKSPTPEQLKLQPKLDDAAFAKQLIPQVDSRIELLKGLVDQLNTNEAMQDPSFYDRLQSISHELDMLNNRRRQLDQIANGASVDEVIAKGVEQGKKAQEQRAARPAYDPQEMANEMNAVRSQEQAIRRQQDQGPIDNQNASNSNIEHRVYSDGTPYTIAYSTRKRTDGTYTLVRVVTDSDGVHGLEHLSNDGSWKKGEPSLTAVSGFFSDEGGPEIFKTPEEALNFDRQDNTNVSNRTSYEASIKAAQEASQPKQTPYDTAVQKIGEALNASDAEVTDMRSKIQEKINSLDADDTKNSAKLEAFKLERDAYDSMLNGEVIDQAWFDKRQQKQNQQQALSTKVKLDPFRSEQDVVTDTNNVTTSINALKKTMDEFAPLKDEMNTLKEKRNPTIEESLRLQELEDIYSHLTLKNDPINEFHGIKQQYIDELHNLKDIEKDDPLYVEQRRPIVEKILSKLDEFYTKSIESINNEKPTTDGITVEELHPVDEVTGTLPKPKSVSDILNSGGDIIGQLRDKADQFFDRLPGTRNVQVDKALSSIPDVMPVLQHFINKLGLGKDNIYFTLDDRSGKAGGLSHIGDTSIIRINPESIAKFVNDGDYSGVNFGKELTGDALTKAKTTYAYVRVAAHELGHLVFNKYIRSFVRNETDFSALKNSFNEYLNENSNRGPNVAVTDFWNATSAEKYAQNQQFFHEYFAERVTNELLNTHALDAFGHGERSAKVGTQLKRIIVASVDYLYKKGIEVYKNQFGDDLIQNLIQRNQDSIKETGETIWERLDREANMKELEKDQFGNMTLEKILKLDSVQDTLPNKKPITLEKDIFLGLDTNDVDSVPNGLLYVLARGRAILAESIFNRNNIADMNPSDRPILDFHKQSRDIDIQMERIGNDLMFGKDVPKGTKPWQLFSKLKNPDSWSAIRTRYSDMEFYHVHEVYRKAFDEGLNMYEALQKYGKELTSDEQTLYQKLDSNVFEKIWQAKDKALNDLGKNSSINKRPGWYSSERQGRFQVSINYGGIMAHMQSFNTRLAADKFRQQLVNSDLKHFDISDVIDKGDTPPTFANDDVVRAIVESFARKTPKHAAWWNEQGNRLLESMLQRGGRLGKSQEYRYNVMGYMGSEMFKTPQELGASFKAGIDQSVRNTSLQIKSLYYRTKLQPILESGNLKPHQQSAAQAMFDMALNRTPNSLEELGAGMLYSSDKAADALLKAIGFSEGKTTDMAAVKQVASAMKSTLYLWKVIPKPIFALLEHAISLPAPTIAKMSYERPVGSYLSFARGMFKLFSGNKELWNHIYDLAQHTDTFEPSLIESQMAAKGNNFLTTFQNWALLQTPAKVGEVGGRMAAFAVFYDHYRALGLDEQTAVTNAIRKTGDALSTFNNDNHPTIYRRMGFIGDAIKPLTNYPQNLLGNLIGMYKYAMDNGSTKGVSAWAPLINYMMVGTLMSGAIGLPVVAEYEELRKWLAKKDIANLPSILDIVASRNESLDEIISPETRTLGVWSKTGYDLANSARSDELLPAKLLKLFTGNASFNDVMPTVENTQGMLASIGTLGMGAIGKATHGEMAEAAGNLLPVGPVGYGIKQMLGLNTTKVMGKDTGQLMSRSGEAFQPQSQQDINAGMLGTQTTDTKMGKLASAEVSQSEMIRKEQFQRRMELFAETGNEKYLEGMEQFFPSKEEAINQIKTAIRNREVPQLIRQMTDEHGHLMQGRGTRAAMLLNKFGRLK